ncbi:p53-like transcription factor [Rozella allomycis CSF55]|nr:p53-like transcription factor [Rozella allomycis CSF55]
MMDVVPVSKRRLRFRNGSWNYSQKSEELSPIGLYKMYKSEEQATYGENLMKNGFSFAKAKLSNDQGKITDIDFSKELITQVISEDQSNHLIVQSFYRYVPRIHIVEHDTKDLLFHDNLLTTTFTFQELEFVGVTHYQNQAVNSLKKSYNPHAKGFKEDIAVEIPLKDKWTLEPPKIEFWDLKSAVMDGLRLFDISRGNVKRKRGEESSSSDEEWH